VDTPTGLGLSVSSDGSRLTAFGTTEVRSWQLSGGQWRPGEARDIQMPEGWQILAASPDGRHLAVSAAYAPAQTDHSLRIVSANGDTVVLPGWSAKLAHVAFDAGGGQVAAAAFDRPLRIAVWDLNAPGATARYLEDAAGSAVTDLAFSPDGRVLATADLGSCVHAWMVATARMLPPFCDKEGMPGRLAFNADGSMLAVGETNGGRVRLFRLRREERLEPAAVLEGHHEGVTAVAFAARGALIVSASRDGTTSIWDVASGLPIASIETPGDDFIRDLAVAREGRWFAALAQGGRRLSVWPLDLEVWTQAAERSLLGTPPFP
jgi:WD40 repeat protein